MSLALPDASGIFGTGGDSLKKASDLNQAAEFGLMGAGLSALARQRANEYRRQAFEETANMEAQGTWTRGLMDAGFTLLGGGLSAGLKNMQANRPTLGSGEVTAPSIDIANPTAGEKALMDAKYKLHGW